MGTDYTGQIIDDRYKVYWLLQEGGMGAVWAGEHIRMGKKVAIKFLHTNFLNDDVVVKRFNRESQVAAKLQHPNIIDVMDTGVAGDEPYLVMEYLEGESLHSMLKRTGPLDLGTTFGIIEPVLHALETAHHQGIIHRDLKPDNIFLSQPQSGDTVVKLIDFGISKLMDPSEQSQLTMTGSALGTPMYMSPEQIAADENLDHRTDIYALGVILYKMLTGRLPFKAENQHQLLMKIMAEDPVPPKEAYPEFPASMEPVVMKLLRKDPDERYNSAEAVLNELKGFDAFSDRKEELSLFTATISIKNAVALGNIGEPSESGPDRTTGGRRTGGTGSGRLSGELPSESTRDRWSNTVGTRPRRKWAVALAATAVLGILVGMFLLMGRPGNPAPEAPPAAALPAGATVQTPVTASTGRAVRIQVTGAPPNATIQYGNAPVPENPFFVEPSKKLVQLKVDAPGRESFVQWVVPDRDRTIDVSRQVAKPAPDAVPPTPEKAPPSEPSAKPSPGDRIIDVGGGAKLTATFED